MKKITIPVDLAVRRFYRAYVTVDESADKDMIRKAAVEMVCDEQDRALTEDPDMEIEPHDIQVIDIDYDGAWEDDEE